MYFSFSSHSHKDIITAWLHNIILAHFFLLLQDQFGPIILHLQIDRQTDRLAIATAFTIPSLCQPDNTFPTFFLLLWDFSCSESFVYVYYDYCYSDNVFVAWDSSKHSLDFPRALTWILPWTTMPFLQLYCARMYSCQFCIRIMHDSFPAQWTAPQAGGRMGGSLLLFYTTVKLKLCSRAPSASYRQRWDVSMCKFPVASSRVRYI